MRWINTGAVLLGLLLFTGCGGNAPSTKADALVDGVLGAYGGLERLGEIRGYRMVGLLHAVQRGQAAPTQRWFQRPDRLRVEIAYPDHFEVRWTAGEEAWVGSSADDRRPAKPLMVQSMRLQTLRMDFPLLLHERRRDVEVLPLDSAGRIPLRLAFDESLTLTWHVDPESHRIPQVTMNMVGPPAMTFSAHYDLFHEVEGVLVAFRERTFSGDVQTSMFQATDFKIDPPDLVARTRVPSDL